VKRANARASQFLAPVLLWVATIAGLVLGLIGDGVFDVVSWLGVGAPLVVAWIARRPRHRDRGGSG